MTPRAQGGDTRSGRIELVGAAILAMVAEAPDITPAEIADGLERKHGQRIAPSTVHRFFGRHGWSFKKDRPCQRAGSRGHRRGTRSLVRGAAGPGPGAADLHRRDMAEHQDGPAAWPGAAGRAPARTHPHGHWRTTTFVAGLRLSGIDAPMVIDGPINGESFLADVRQVLAPALRPGDVVVMDNLGSHKGAAVRAAMVKAGRRSSAQPSPSQGPSPQSRRPHPRYPLDRRRRRDRRLHTCRVQILLHCRRL